MRRPGQGKKNTHRYSAAEAAVRAAAKESRLNHYDGYGADEPMLQQQTAASMAASLGGLAAAASTMTGSSKMMHVMDNDNDVYYKKLPSVPPPPVSGAPVNGGKHLEDFKVIYRIGMPFSQLIYEFLNSSFPQSF